MKKRILAMLLVVATLVLTLASCGFNYETSDLSAYTEFDKAAFELPVGKVSEPVKTQYGYHLVFVTEKIPAVEAKGDTPASPEKVRASHILIKVENPRPVPKAEEVIESLKKQSEGEFVRNFVMAEIEKAKIEAFDDEYKAFVPKSAAKDACGDKDCGECPVEKTEGK
jgi:hypothetical protein